MECLQDIRKVCMLDVQRRNAIHEIGHAIILFHINPTMPSVRVSIRQRALSLGRVSVSNMILGNATERELKNILMVLLAGRNAEILFLGDSAVGCYEDYAKAKKIAGDMVNLFAMGTIGKYTSDDFLQEADRKVTAILSQYKDSVEYLVTELLDKKELDGENLVKLLNKR